MSSMSSMSKHAAREYALAGNATLTLRSERTGKHYTYQVVSAANGNEVHFVRVLAGEEYAFLGTVFDRARYFPGKRSRIASDAPSARVWAWFWRCLMAPGEFPAALTVYHDGTCGKCGRKLTHPGSIETGLGPVCAGKA